MKFLVSQDEFSSLAHREIHKLFSEQFKATSQLGAKLSILGGWGQALLQNDLDRPAANSLDAILSGATADISEWSPPDPRPLELKPHVTPNATRLKSGVLSVYSCKQLNSENVSCRFSCQPKVHWTAEFYTLLDGVRAHSTDATNGPWERMAGRLRPQNITQFSLAPPASINTPGSRFLEVVHGLESDPLLLPDLIFQGIPLDVASSNKIVRITRSQVVKFGPLMSLSEGRVMQFIAKETTIPVPRVYENFSRTNVEGMSIVYLVMEYIDGRPLNTIWLQLEEVARIAIVDSLKGYLPQIRGILRPQFNEYMSHLHLTDDWLICSMDGGPVPGFFFREEPAGPFKSESEFNDWLGGNSDSVYRKMLSDNHQIFFSHGDLASRNIMVDNEGRILAIIDWGWAGWYPEYREFVQSVSTADTRDWWKYMEQATGPYYTELGMYELMKNFG